MKRFFIFVAAISLCVAAFAASPVKIAEQKLTSDKYIDQLADKFDVESTYDDDNCFFGVNKADGTCVFYYTEVYADGRFTYAFANNGSAFVSSSEFNEKNTDTPMDVKISENQNLINHTESGDSYVTDAGKKMYTSLMAYLRAECLKNYPKAAAMIPDYAKTRNAEILKAGKPEDEAAMDSILAIMKKYNK